MSEYIERKTVIEHIKEIPAYFNSSDINYGIELAIQTIKDESTTEDVVKITHGQWQKYYKSGTTVSDGFVSSCCDMWNERKTPYCPNCGAKMDGERKDENA